MEAVYNINKYQRDIDECWEEAFGEPFHLLWFLPINRNKIRDVYAKGRLPDDDKAEEEMKEEKKEAVEDQKNLKKEVKKQEDRNELKKEKQNLFRFIYTDNI